MLNSFNYHPVNIITIKCRVQLLPVFDDSPGLDFNLHVLLFGATKCAIVDGTKREEAELGWHPCCGEFCIGSVDLLATIIILYSCLVSE